MTQTEYVRHTLREAERVTRDAMGDEAYEAARAEVAADNAQHDAAMASSQCCEACSGAGMDDSGDDCEACGGTGGWA